MSGVRRGTTNRPTRGKAGRDDRRAEKDAKTTNRPERRDLRSGRFGVRESRTGRRSAEDGFGEQLTDE